MTKTKTKEITVQVNVPKPHQNAKIDVSKAVEMRLRGLTLEEIGNQFGATKGAVHKAISKYCPDAIDVQVYKDNESNLLAALKSRIVNNISDEKIADMNAYQLSTMLAMMIDKSRLIDGKSTSNVEAVISSAMDIVNKRDDLK
jgi:hypothetical protein